MHAVVMNTVCLQHCPDALCICVDGTYVDDLIIL